MSIDIRNVPTLYINLDDEKKRDIEMRRMLTDLGFHRFDRFSAKKAQRGADGCYLSHINAAYQLYESNDSDYVLVLEDDAVITNVDKLNDIINIANARYAFDIFSNHCRIPMGSSENDLTDTLACPPLRNTYGTYFMLYKRQSVPNAIIDLTKRYYTAGAVDIWHIPGSCRTCIQYGTDCIRAIMNYYPSRTGGGHILYIHVLPGCNESVTYFDIVDKIRCDARIPPNMLLHHIYIPLGNELLKLTPGVRRKVIASYTDDLDVVKLILIDCAQLLSCPNIAHVFMNNDGRYIKIR